MTSHLSPTAVLLTRWTALLALAWAVHALLQNRHPRWRLTLWRSVLCFCVLMPFVRLTLLKFPIPSALAPIERSITQNTPAPFAPPTQASGVSLPAQPVALRPIRQITTFVPTPSATVHKPIPWRALALSAWALGALWAMSRLVRFHLILHRLRAQSEPAPETLQKQARKIAARLGVARPFAIQISAATSSPFAAGLFRPVVLLPEKLVDGLPDEEVNVLLAHEIAHFRRRDLFWCIAWRWFQAVCWPHPLVWAIPAAHNLACEEEADRVAAGSLQDGAQYSQLLARLALRVIELPRLETHLVLNAASHIARRLDRLKTAPARIWGWKHSTAGFALVGALFLVTAACGFSSGDTPSADNQSSAPDKAATNQSALASSHPASTAEEWPTWPSKAALPFFMHGSSLATSGQFQDAVADFQQGLHAHPSSDLMWLWYTSLLIQNRDLSQYRATCKEMLRRFNDTTHSQTAEIVAKCALWIPGAIDPKDFSQAVKLAGQSVALTDAGDFKPWPRMAKGLAAYRQGQFKSATDILDPLMKEMDDHEKSGDKTPSFDTCQPNVCLIDAMAHRQLNETDQARAAIDQGHQIVRDRLPAVDSQNLGGDWMNVLMTYTLMSEADKTVGIAFPSRPDTAYKSPAETATPLTAADLAKMPHSYKFGDGDGLRVWQRIDDHTWHEVYPDGFTSVFKIVGRDKVGETEGTVVAKIAGDPARTGTPNDGTLQAFIPDKDSPVMHHWFRFSPNDDWRDLAPMTDVQ